jgi:hypothetical protein
MWPQCGVCRCNRSLLERLGKLTQDWLDAAPEGLDNPPKHTLLFNPEYHVNTMINKGGVTMVGSSDISFDYATGIAFTPVLGKTRTQYDMKELGPRSPFRCHSRNSDAWFRVDLRKNWIDRAEVLFIKPKP